mmetsp:Transcript_136060/g.435216  ORF Transcript_136060/g.435216 Transcript_136060/m.435216 type:complete len:302 (-) Transcript_136060:305-1210(-)
MTLRDTARRPRSVPNLRHAALEHRLSMWPQRPRWAPRCSPWTALGAPRSLRRQRSASKSRSWPGVWGGASSRRRPGVRRSAVSTRAHRAARPSRTQWPVGRRRQPTAPPRCSPWAALGGPRSFRRQRSAFRTRSWPGAWGGANSRRPPGVRCEAVSTRAHRAARPSRIRWPVGRRTRPTEPPRCTPRAALGGPRLSPRPRSTSRHSSWPGAWEGPRRRQLRQQRTRPLRRCRPKGPPDEAPAVVTRALPLGGPRRRKMRLRSWPPSTASGWTALAATRCGASSGSSQTRAGRRSCSSGGTS